MEERLGVNGDDLRGPDDRALRALRRWAVLLDSAFQVPGTNMRFGLDPIVGLLPGAGDLVTGFFSVMILLHSLRLKIPKIVVARMLANTALDLATGAVPILGDLFDAGYKANLKNLRLLERHARPGVKPERSDYIFVSVCIGLVLLAAIVPIFVLWWLIMQVSLI
jgi:hypothetical protein